MYPVVHKRKTRKKLIKWMDVWKPSDQEFKGCTCDVFSFFIGLLLWHLQGGVKHIWKNWEWVLDQWNHNSSLESERVAYIKSREEYDQAVFVRQWPSDRFIPMVESALQGQIPLEPHAELWPYWVKYRDYLLPKCDQYPGRVSDRIRTLIHDREYLKLPHSKFEMIL